MTAINLLPWREAQRKEKQQQFFMALGGAVAVMLLIVGVAHLHVESMIDAQNSRNSFLQSQIDRVEKQIVEIDAIEKEKQSLLSRMTVIQELQQGRSEMVHVFDEMVKVIPDGVYVTDLKQQEGVFELVGKAQSNARVSSLMRNFDASEWFKDPKLTEIVSVKDAKTGTRESKFKLVVNLSSQSVEESEEG